MKKEFEQLVNGDMCKFTIQINSRTERMAPSTHPDFEDVPPRVVEFFVATGGFKSMATNVFFGNVVFREYKSETILLGSIAAFEKHLVDKAYDIMKQRKEETFEQKMEKLGYK